MVTCELLSLYVSPDFLPYIQIQNENMEYLINAINFFYTKLRLFLIAA